MWTTLDSFRLRLPAPTLARLIAGRGRLGLAELVGPRAGAGQPCAAAGAIGGLVRRATYLGTLRRPGAPGPLWLFGARLAGRPYRIVARPSGPGRAAIVAVRGGRPSSSAERASAGQDAAITEIIRSLEGAGLTLHPTGSRRPPGPGAILKDRVQLTAGGQTVDRAENQPDVAYVDPATGQRINVEVASSPGEVRADIQKYIRLGPDGRPTGRANDPAARYIFVQADPDSSRGSARRAHIFTPRPGGGPPIHQVVRGPLLPRHLLTRARQRRPVLPAARQRGLARRPPSTVLAGRPASPPPGPLRRLTVRRAAPALRGLLRRLR